MTDQRKPGDLCRFLAWDSDFFGARVARTDVHVLTPETVTAIRAWCAAEKIDCLYFLADPADALTARLAEANHFAFVDTRMTLDTRLAAPPTVPANVRLSREADLPALKAIARVNHRDSRFYFDPNFLDERCDALYETWIERSCNGYADAVLVGTVDDGAVGYLTCDLNPDGKGQIGLLGVGEAYRGQGIGSGLIRAGLAWFWDHDVRHVEVVTQGRNVGAQRAYQKHGFMTANVQHWYHGWFG